MEEQKDIFYIGMENPEALRENLHSIYNEMVESLDRFEKFKEIREERHESITQFKENMKDLNKLMIKLGNILPKTGLKANIDASIKKPEKLKVKAKEPQPKKVITQGKPAIKPMAQKKTIEKAPSDLDKLESELDEIEKKLDSLN